VQWLDMSLLGFVPHPNLRKDESAKNVGWGDAGTPTRVGRIRASLSERKQPGKKGFLI
jgi:hypothetical protein